MSGNIVQLPFPPSVNSIWKRGRNKRTKKPVVYLDAKYKLWKVAADRMLMTQKPLPKIEGHFTAVVTFDQSKRRADVDNLLKCVMDCLQRAEIITNDRFADSVTARWGDVEGCTVELVAA